MVTADGKTWDEVTRDVSYIGNACVASNTDTQNANDNTNIVEFDEWRGKGTGATYFNYNKDWAISWDRLICLVDGHYFITLHTLGDPGNEVRFLVNGVRVNSGHGASSDHSVSAQLTYHFNRGDFFQLQGSWYGTGGQYGQFNIDRL